MLDFTDPDLPGALDTLPDEDLLNAPFGVVRMDCDGIVTLYNYEERRLSGLSAEQTVGQNFFRDVAPCTNNFMVAERFKEPAIDEVVEYVFTFAMEPTEVTLRLIRRGDVLYMLVRRQ